MTVRDRTAATFAAILISICGSAFAQSQVVFAFIGVRTSDDAVTATEIRVLENRLTTYLVELADQEDYGLIIPNNREQVLSEIEFSQAGTQDKLQAGKLVAARGLIAGEINRIGSRYYLDLDLIRVDTGETVNHVSDDYSSYDMLLDGSRSTVFSLFQLSAPGIAESSAGASGSALSSSSGGAQSSAAGGNVPATTGTPSGTTVTRPTLAMIAGTWQGDRGIQSVLIRPDGSATAKIDDTNTMSLRVSISGNTIIVRQDEPNAPKMYLSLYPYSIAVQIVQLARPMSWSFQLDANRKFLQGTKQTTAFRIEQGQIAAVDNTYSRPASWQRME